jgi:alkylated DNA repair protein (DNA oxidative demethylase)
MTVHHLKGFIKNRAAFITAVSKIVETAPIVTPTMQSGAAFNTRVTNCGRYGWYAHRGHYGYSTKHPETQQPWPDMPAEIHEIALSALDVADVPHRDKYLKFNSCLFNFYPSNGSLGLHQDKDEEDLDFPIVSLSFGDTAALQVGGPNRTDPCKTYLLQDCDLLILAPPSRRHFHGVKQIFQGSYPEKLPFPNTARLNVTIRQAKRP